MYSLYVYTLLIPTRGCKGIVSRERWCACLDPEGDPRHHDDEAGGDVRVEHEVPEVYGYSWREKVCTKISCEIFCNLERKKWHKFPNIEKCIMYYCISGTQQYQRGQGCPTSWDLNVWGQSSWDLNVWGHNVQQNIYFMLMAPGGETLPLVA